MTSSIHTRIEQLTPRLSKIAAIHARATNETADDLFQAMVVHLLERQQADPNFCNQNDSYLLDAGRKQVCWNAVRRTGIEAKYITAEPVIETDEGGDDSFFDTLPDPYPNPEVAQENLEQALAIAQVVREQLSDREREVVALAVSGVSNKQICAMYGFSTATVSVYKRRAAEKIRSAYQ